MKPSQESYIPSHLEFIVEFAPGDFRSFLKAQKVCRVTASPEPYPDSDKAFDAGDFLVSLEGLTRAPKAYTSVQCGRGSEDHLEVNSDLVYSPLHPYRYSYLPLRCSS
jgi:hypothetical protein